MSKNLISKDECTSVVCKLNEGLSNEVQVINYEVDKYGEGYPGFLGEYFSLKIQFIDVSKIHLFACTR